MNDKDLKLIEQLRSRGYAVSVFSVEDIEDHMVMEGNRVLVAYMAEEGFPSTNDEEE